jgi:hypothetical protein
LYYGIISLQVRASNSGATERLRESRHLSCRLSKVSEALKQFEAKLQALVAELDALLPIGQDPNADQLAAIELFGERSNNSLTLQGSAPIGRGSNLPHSPFCT